MYLFSKKYLWLLLSLSLLENSFVTAFKRENDQEQNNYITTEEKKLQDQIVTFFKEHKETIAASGVTALLTFIFTYMLVDYKKNKELKRESIELSNINSDDELSDIDIDNNQCEISMKTLKQQVDDLNNQKKELEENIKNKKKEFEQLKQNTESVNNQHNDHQYSNDNEIYNVNNNDQNYYEKLKKLVNENNFLKEELDFVTKELFYANNILDKTNKYNFGIGKVDLSNNQEIRKYHLNEDNVLDFLSTCNDDEVAMFKLKKLNLNCINYRYSFTFSFDLYASSCLNNKPLSDLDCDYIFVPYAKKHCEVTKKQLKEKIGMFACEELKKDSNRVITVIYYKYNDEKTFSRTSFSRLFDELLKNIFQSAKVSHIIVIGNNNYDVAFEFIQYCNGYNNYIEMYNCKKRKFDIENATLMTYDVTTEKASELLKDFEFTNIQFKQRMIEGDLKVIGSIFNFYSTTDFENNYNKLGEGINSSVKYVDCRCSIGDNNGLTGGDFILNVLLSLSFQYRFLKETSGVMTNLHFNTTYDDSNMMTCRFGVRNLDPNKSINENRTRFVTKNKYRYEQSFLIDNMQELQHMYNSIEDESVLSLSTNVLNNNFVTNIVNNKSFQLVERVEKFSEYAFKGFNDYYKNNNNSTDTKNNNNDFEIEK